MSIMDLDSLSPVALVTQFIVEKRGKGHFVTRDEMTLIQGWLEHAQGNPDDVILVLEEILEKKIKQKDDRQKIISLLSIQKSVLKRLQEKSALLASGGAK